MFGAGLIAASALGLACGCSGSRNSSAASPDPERQAVSEYDIARDLFLTRREPRPALRHALKAVELHDEYPDAEHLIALIYLYFCASSSPVECRLQEAELFARRAIDHRKDFREAQNTLAVILVHQKRYADAVAVLEALTKDILYPTPETAWGNLGWAYLLDGQPKLAADSLRRAVALQPDFCVGWYRLGLAYEKLGEQSNARDVFSRALETDRPECKGLQDAFKARARVALRLGDRESARDDLRRCSELGGETPSGRECAASLANME